MRFKHLIGPLLLILGLLAAGSPAVATEWVDHYDAKDGYLYAGDGISTITFDDWGYSGPGPGGKPENGRNAKQFAPINGFGTLGQRQHVATLWPDRLTPDDPHAILKDMTNSPEYTNANMDAQVNFYLWGYTSPGFDRQSSWEAYSAYRAEDYSGSVRKGSLFNNMLIDLDGDYSVSKNDMHFNYYDGFSYVDATGANPPESVATSLSFQPYPISDAIGWCGSVMASHPAACAVMAGQLTFDFAFDVYFTDPDQPGRSFMGTQIVPGFEMRSYGSLNVHVWVGNVLQSYSSNAVVNNTNPGTADRWDVDPAYYSNVSFHGGGVLPNRVWVSADSFNPDGSKKLNPDGTWNVTVVPEGTPGAHSHDNAFAGYAFILRADGIRLLDYFNEAAYGPDPCTNVNCDDNNVCTTDSCVGGLCIHTNNTLPCSDNNACTTGDVCANGACQPGAPADCYDGKTCTIDSCDPAIGCVNTPIPGCGDCAGKPDGTHCEDGNPCTDHDSCVQGVCYSGPVRNCDDGNACTDDSCSGGFCVHVNNTLPCNDGNACTTGDVCSNGVCAGTPKNCDDGNVCTFDSCDTVTGNCVYAFNHSRCNDGNACTSGDVCSNGVCAGTPKNCDDGDACTVDSCDTATGICAHAQMPGCVTELLQGRLLIENGAFFCMGSPYPSGSCVPFVGGSDGGLLLGQYQPMQIIPGVCGNVTGNGQGTGYGLPADGGGSQVIAAVFDFFGVPTYPSTNAISWQACTPHNPPSVTAGAVDPVTGCRTLTGEISAWDVLWNGAEFEQGPRGGTPAHPVPMYATGKLCPDNSYDLSWPALIIGGPFNAVTGYWLLAGHLNQCMTATCNDGNVCTDDSFNPVTCQCIHAFNTKPCDDHNPGTVQDRCSNGVCAGIPAGCDDNNVCTDDSVDPVTGLCLHIFNTAPCNDGDPCTLNDTCAGGVCAGTPKNCTIGNPCTTDSCDGATGACVHTWFCNLPDPLPDGSILGIDQGVGSATNTPCATGSCFGMEVSPGYVIWTDYGPGADGGFVLGKNQVPGGQETDGSITDTGELSNAWFFFGGYGTFFTSPDGGTRNRFDRASCTGTGCFGKTELKVFNVAWNAGIIPMGSAAGCTLPACTPDELADIFVNDYQVDLVSGAWSMHYAQVVPSGSFKGVRFSAIIRGTVTVPDLCADVICDPTTSACQQNVCNPSTGICELSNLPNGTACNDNLKCTTNDVCTNGTCGGIPKVCTGANPCKNYGVCNSSTGTCPVLTNKPNGTACDDNNACTTTDVCTNGSCGGTAVVCTASDQCHDAGTCTAGVCSNPIKTNGTSCNDNNACTTTDVCTNGVCGGTAVVCTASDQCHVAGTCTAGVCSNPSKPNGSACNDGNACTTGDVCINGTCAGTPKICTALDQCHVAGVCDPATGACSNPPAPNGTPCVDGNACSIGEGTCQGGVCQPGPSMVCPALDQCHVAGVCNTATGVCSNPTKPNGTACNDNNVCTTGESCQNGICTGGLVLTCPPDQCHVAGTCDPITGVCSNPSKPNGSACNDGNACTTNDVCNNGVCGGVPIVCAALDQCHMAGVCDTSTGICSNPKKPDGTPCNDGDACTVGDTCLSGVCTPGMPIACAPAPVCKVNIPCDPATGTCSYANLPNGTPCPGEDICYGEGTCQNGICVQPLIPVVVCKALDQCHVAGTCVSTTGICSNPIKPNGSACNDGNACTTGESCQSGNCTGGTTKVCTALDQCHLAGTCDTATGVCSSSPPAPNGTNCNDNNSCTTNDVCTNGVCGGTPKVCPSATACTVVGACDPATGVCPVTNKTNGTSCDDGNLCNGLETCQTGVCTKGTAVTCPAATACTTVGACIPATGVCPVTNKSNGTSCADADLCNGNETCQSGVCMAGTPVVCTPPQTCNPATGLCGGGLPYDCTGKPAGTACTDNNDCTSNDKCQMSGKKMVCKGTSVANGTACNDGNLCTTNDKCSSGVCKGTAMNCNDHNRCTTDSCDSATGSCVHTFDKPKSVTVLGSNLTHESLATNQQIQTSFTVTNDGCIVASGDAYVYVSAGSVVDVDCKTNSNPKPTTLKLNGVIQPMPTGPGTFTCPDAITQHLLYLDNLKAVGGKDTDYILLMGNAQD